MKRGNILANDLGEIAVVSFYLTRDRLTADRGTKKDERIWWVGDVRRISFLATGTTVTG